MPSFRDQLKPLVMDALIHEPTVLSSGRLSSFYFDARMVTLRADGAYLLARHILETVPPDSYDAIGGMTMGADPIASAVSALSWELGTPKPAFIVRKAPKDHGRRKRVEGPLPQGARVVIVEDVTTSGGSALDAIRAVEAEAGAEVVRVVSLVDRQQGAAALFEDAGYLFTPVFTAQELGITREEIESEARSAEEAGPPLS
ncbi:MAG TPA: orotate phosphoribosyltransferase [Coriobacteriia bacterium]|jgi:orotate phosphoribosyltransferase